jgi:hypothetical protein
VIATGRRQMQTFFRRLMFCWALEPACPVAELTEAVTPYLPHIPEQTKKARLSQKRVSPFFSYAASLRFSE